MARIERGDLILAAAGVVFGVAAAAGYAAWRAAGSDGGASARWGDFGAAMLFPGALIAAVVAVVVWLGWKANIDG